MSRVSLLLVALLFAAPARAGVGRAVEISLPSESPSFKTGVSPVPTLQLGPSSLIPTSLAPALAPSALTPSIQVPVAAQALTPVPALPAAAAPVAEGVSARPVEALKQTGAALSAVKPGSGGEVAPLNALFDAGASRGQSASVAEGPGGATPAALAPSKPSSGRRMPPGVAKAFKNSAVLGGGMAALSAGLWTAFQHQANAPTPLAFAVVAFPLLLIPLHFALVSGFWASRYWGYPKLSASGKTAFRAAWSALAFAYPTAALAGMSLWLQAFGSNSAMLLLFGPAALVALGEVAHHFLYRGPAERAQDEGKSFFDWRDRAGGNIGQQLRRMYAKKS